LANQSVISALQGVSLSEVASLNYQVLIVDKGNWTKAQVTQMGGGAADPRTLLGYMSLGEAEDYRSYWQSSWNTNPPSWLGPENPSWEGNYTVKYWDPAWQTIAKTYIKGIVDAGFDGVNFDMVDAFDYPFVKNDPNHPPAVAQQEMINLVDSLSDYAKGLNPNFKVYVNNAEVLLSNATYLSAIDGVLHEGLYGTSGTGSNSIETQLDKALGAGKNVSVIEYVSSQAGINNVVAQATADGYGYYIADRSLSGISDYGFSMFQQSAVSPPAVPPVVPVVPPVVPPAPAPTVNLIDATTRTQSLVGTVGADVFQFASNAEVKSDKVYGFNRAADLIDLHLIDADTLQASNNAFSWVGTKAFTTAGNELRVTYDAKWGASVVELNTDHDTAAEAVFRVANTRYLSADDFIL